MSTIENEQMLKQELKRIADGLRLCEVLGQQIKELKKDINDVKGLCQICSRV